MNLSDLRGLLDANDATAKNDAMNMGLMQAGLAMLGNSRAGFGPAAMAAGQAGLGAYNSTLDRSQSQLMQKIQMNQLLKKLQTEEILAKALRGDTAPAKTTAGPTPAGLSQSSQSAFGMDYNPALDSAPKAAPVSGTQSYAQRLLEAARQAGDVTAFTEAQKMLLEEKKLAPKFATDVRVVMKNGQPTALQMADDGTVREMAGFSPAEKLHFADNGAMAGIGIDQYTGKPVTQGIRKEMSPDAKASNALGWATYNKPQYVADLNAFVGNPGKGGNVSVMPVTLPTGMMSKGQREDTDSLRKEFEGLQPVKDLRTSYPAYAAIKEAAKGDSPQSDINLVYGLAKLFDPGSVVREGEYATIANSQAIPEWLKGMAQNLKEGKGKLTAATKDELIKQADIRIKTFEDQYSGVRGQYSQIASKRNMDQGSLFTPIGRFDEQGKKVVADEAAPLPPNPTASNLVKGKLYQTPRGLAVWDGMKFNAKGG